MQNPKESIINAAATLFEQFGIRSVSIDNVCGELRISKKTFYNYFSQKEELVETVLEYREKLAVEKYTKMFRNKNAIDSLILIIKELRKNMEHSSPVMCYDLEKYYPRIYERVELKKRQMVRESFEANLRRGIEEGYYREDLDVELISIFHSIQIKNTFDLMVQDAKKYPKKRVVDFFVDLIVHLIANEKGLKYIEENYCKTE